jgi:hypothetical protein
VTAADEQRRLRGDQALEILAVLILGLATIGTAWCGFQASRWSGEEGRRARESSDLRIEASRQFGLASQIVQYDTNTVSDYAQALADRNDELATFIRTSLARDEFVPILDQWKAEYGLGEDPANLLENQAYLDAQFAEFRATDAESETVAAAAEQAARNSDRYVGNTVLLAMALFFAGVTGSFRNRVPRLLMLSGAGLIAAWVASQLIDLPVA